MILRIRLRYINFFWSQTIFYHALFFSVPGVEAEHAANVFYYLTYEGSVDLDSITDNVTKEVSFI